MCIGVSACQHAVCCRLGPLWHAPVDESVCWCMENAWRLPKVTEPLSRFWAGLTVRHEALLGCRHTPAGQPTTSHQQQLGHPCLARTSDCIGRTSGLDAVCALLLPTKLHACKTLHCVLAVMLLP